MPIIQADTSIITQINVFTVPQGQQQPLIDYLSGAARVASEIDGWLSASLHRSLDGRRVVNYAQSADEDAAGRVFEHLRSKRMLDGNKAFGEAHPGLYEVAFTLGSGLVDQSQKMTVAASAMAEKKTVGHRS